jgi:hypothetical protein
VTTQTLAPVADNVRDGEISEDAPAVPEVEVTGPGVYGDMPFEQYLARPELSSTDLLKLVEDCPAMFKWDKANPAPPKKEFDFGSVAHKLILGEGKQVKVLKDSRGAPFEDMRSGAAREAKERAYANGQIPILQKDYAHATAMAWQVQHHPIAAGLLTEGKPEQSAFWKDPRTQVDMRCRFDWLRERRDPRLIIVDYKTTSKGLGSFALERTIYEHGYHQRMAHYRDGAIVLGLGDETTVINLIFQMTKPPYLVHVVQFTPEMIKLGRARNAAAVDTYLECTASGYWPAYDDVANVALPGWAEARDMEYLNV